MNDGFGDFVSWSELRDFRKLASETFWWLPAYREKEVKLPKGIVAMSNPLLRISSVRTHILLFAMVLLFVNASAVVAQNANTPAGNTNTNTAANTNTNANANVNANANTNTQNTNANTDTNANANTNQSATAAAVEQEARRSRIAATYWFPVVIAAMFGLVLIPFAWTIMRAIRYSKSTFNNPLGLPEGSLRAMLAFMLVSFLGFYVLASILSITDIKPPEFLIGIVATVIGFYFGSRSVEDKGAASVRTGSVAGTVTDKSGTAAVGAAVNLTQGVKKFTQPTDLNGKYRIENVPSGDYDIQASLSGHNPSDSAKVKIAAAATQTVDLKLK